MIARLVRWIRGTRQQSAHKPSAPREPTRSAGPRVGRQKLDPALLEPGAEAVARARFYETYHHYERCEQRDREWKAGKWGPPPR